MLWLAKHDAPPNMRLVTDLELHLIDRGLNAERTKALDYEKRCSFLETQLARAIKDTDSFLTTLQSLANQMDEPTGLAIIYAESARVGETIATLKAKP
jgi:hypothetical protein